MEIRLTKSEYDYLISDLPMPEGLRRAILEKNSDAGRSNSVIIQLTNEDADRIRDLCGEQLQVRGFDKKYGLTQAGTVLESLIDKLFVKDNA